MPTDGTTAALRLRSASLARDGRCPLSSLIAHFDHLARRCRSREELCTLLADVSRELGFAYFALLHHASLSQPGRKLIRIDNYPEGWVEEILNEGFAQYDPVQLASGRTNIGFCWSELATLVPLAPRHRRILERSARHGLGAGFTIPANVPGEPVGSCSFAVRKGEYIRRERLLCAEQIGARAFSAARRLHDYPAFDARPHLSRRELQCLPLVGAGKTDWEIATILGISEDTARQYVKRARSAYDVASRTQLVVHALRDSWIGFGDVTGGHASKRRRP